jgi:hypothetical protein
MTDILDDIKEDVILVPNELKDRFFKELVGSYVICFALWNFFQLAYWAEIHSVMYYPVLHGIFTTLCGVVNLCILRLRVLGIKKDLDKVSLGTVLRNMVFAATFSVLIGSMLMIGVVIVQMFLHDVIEEIPHYLFVSGILTLIGLGIYSFVFSIADDFIK